MTVPAVVVERAAEATMSETVRCDATGCQNKGERRIGWIAPEGWKFIEIDDADGGSPIVGVYCSLACAVSVIQDARKMGPNESEAMRHYEECKACGQWSRKKTPDDTRWWRTVGAWGAMFDREPMPVSCRIVQVASDLGAWVIGLDGNLLLVSAVMLDGMTPIEPPPGY